MTEIGRIEREIWVNQVFVEKYRKGDMGLVSREGIKREMWVNQVSVEKYRQGQYWVFPKNEKILQL